ncbi:MAG: hypothetical protein IJ379_13360 [Lachnospiraceae bacterium]|nr:hypothetical protein [Lachnospiraceae bacterium]
MEDVTTVAKGIGDFGMMAITAAFFLVLAAGLMVACFKWFKAIINGMIDDNKRLMTNLLDETKKQNDQLTDISEGLRPETMLRIKNTSGVYFDLAIERVCRIIKKVRDENHIIDRDATRKKIHNLLLNLHEDRNSRFDQYTYRGKKLTTYTSPEWVNWVEEVVVTEVYDEVINNGRAYTNVCAVYERIKIDFYRKLNGE